jgi:hypothetical protein
MLRSKRVALATVVAGFLGVGGVAVANTTGTDPPVLTSAPVLSGSAQQGSTDRLTVGTFSNKTSQNGIWYDCPTPGNNPACTKTNPAGGTSYTLQPSDPVGDYLRLDETAVNKTGTSVVWSNVIGPITAAPQPPVLTSSPVLSGSAQQGSTDTLTVGTFSNKTSQTGTWYDCPAAGNNVGCTPTNAAGGTSYTLQPSDPVGDYLRLNETAVNKTGTTTVWSNAIGPITAAPTAPTTTNKLAWAPPTNANPTTINVTTAEEADPYQLTLSTTQDYIVNLPNSDFLGALKIWGGHNVTIIGGHITVPNSATQNDNAKDGSDVGLRIHGSTGTVHIEGVLLDCQNPASTQCDAINIDAPLANVQIENVRADDLWGTYSDAAGGAADTGEHADAIETWGGANSLDVDNFTATGDYQGFTIESELGTTVNSYDLRNVNLVNEPVPSALASISRGGGNMLIVSSYDTACTKQGPMSLSNFYIDDESNGYVSPGNQVWPHVGSTYGCPGVMSGNNVTWPALTNITGHVTLSAPPSGDFVPTGVAGTSYVSPGYTS